MEQATQDSEAQNERVPERELGRILELGKILGSVLTSEEMVSCQAGIVPISSERPAPRDAGADSPDEE